MRTHEEVALRFWIPLIFFLLSQPFAKPPYGFLGLNRFYGSRQIRVGRHVKSLNTDLWQLLLGSSILAGAD
jgi:hypothetical protein